VDPRVSLDDLEKRKFLTLPGLELRPLSRKARSHSLYRLLCLTDYYAIKTCTREWMYVQLAYELEVSGQLHAAAALASEKEPQEPPQE
jgi:hypothetical protein